MRILFLGFLVWAPTVIFGQCQVSNQFPPSPITPDPGGAVTTIANNQWAGSEYCQINSIVDNHVYEFTHANGAYITIREGAVGGPALAMGYSPLAFTTTSTSDLYVHFTVDDLCNQASTGAYLTTVQDQGTPPCDMSGEGGQHPLGAIALVPEGQTTVANDMALGSQFSVLTDVVPGHVYTLEHSGGAHASARQGSVAGPTIGVGDTPLTFQPSTNDDIFVSWAADQDCTPDYTGSYLVTVNDAGLPPCDMSGFGGQYPFATIAPDIGGAVTTIATDQFVGSEYSIIGSVLEGHEYEFVHEAGSFITVREGAVAGPVLGSGYSPLIIITGSTDDLFVHWTLDEFCNEQGSGGGFWLTTVQDGGEACDVTATLTEVVEDYCEGDIIQLEVSFTGTGPFSFDLNDGNGTPVPYTNISDNPYTFFVSIPGTYSLVSVVGSECEGTVSETTVVVHEAPTAVISGGGLRCDENPVGIQIDFTGEAPWNITLENAIGPDIPLPNITQNPYTHMQLDAGVFTVLNLSDANCSGEGSGTVQVGYEEVSATISGGGVSCDGSPVEVQVSFTGQGPWSFDVWEAEYGEYSFHEEITDNPYTTTLSESGVYDLEHVEGAICDGNALGSVTVDIRAPLAGQISGGGAICDNQPVDVQIDLSGTGPWTVTLDDGFGQTQTLPEIQTSPFVFEAVGPANYTIPVIANAPCAVAGTGSAEVVVADPVTATYSNGGTICNGQELEVAISFTGEGPWSFDVVLVGGGHDEYIGITDNPFNVSLDQAGEYYLAFLTGSLCADGNTSGSIFVEVITDLPTAYFDFEYFTSQSVEFTYTGDHAETWMWDFGDGTTSSFENPLNIFTQPGTYDVSLSVTNPCGTDLVSQQVIVGPQNNNFPDALEIFIGPNGPFGNANATVEQNEPTPPTGSGAESCESDDGWCGDDGGLQGTIWFYHTVGESGNVAFDTDGSTFNTQIALTPANPFFSPGPGTNNLISTNHLLDGLESEASGLMGGPTFIAANDDNPDYQLTQYSSRIEVCGLTPGETYFLMVDGYNGEEGLASITLSEILQAAFTNSQNGLSVMFSSSPSVSIGTIVSWDWDFGDGQMVSGENPTHIFSVPNTYEVCLTITDNEGCTAEHCEDVVVSGVPTSIREQVEDRLQVFPNPSSGEFVLEISGVEADVQFNVMDVTGRRVYTEGAVLNGNFRKTLSLDVANGSYLLQVVTLEGLVTRKIEIH